MLTLRFLYRKMWKTRWLTLSTLLGLVVAVAFTTSIPMYSDGSLKRVVSKSLQEQSEGMPAGSILIRYQAVGSDRADLAQLDDVDQYIREEIPEQIGFPAHAYVRQYTLRSAQISPVDPSKVDPSKRRQMSLASLSGLNDQVEWTNGRMPTDQLAGGFIEAAVFEEAMYRNDFRVGDEFTYPIASGSGMPPLKIKVVGSFVPKQDTDPYWYQGFEGLMNTFVVGDSMFTTELLQQKKLPLSIANWYYAFDLREIKTSQLGPLTSKLERLDNNLYQRLKDTRLDISFLPMLSDFKRSSLQMQLLLFTLAAPMLAMVFYYIVMNSRQSLERQRSDIAVIRSRGGSTRQIIWIYVLEGIILGGAALVLGPMIGWFMAKSIGSSSGFLSFVDRKSVPVGVSLEALVYGAAAVIIAMAAMVIPAISYARASIVGLKQQLARADRKPFWHRWFLDIVLLGLAGYGWYLFKEYQLLSMQTGLSTDQLQVHPLLFFVPALSIFAMGLFFLRLFPRLLQLAGWIGGKLLPVPIYLTLTQLTRSSKAYYPLMLLLILTLGLGVYNSSAARTIDLNSTERTLYKYGTDVIIETVWEGYSDDLPKAPNPGQGQGQNPGQGQTPGQGSGQPPGGGNPGGAPGGGPGGGPGNPGQEAPSKIRYVEPPFQVFKDLDGVEAAARVLQSKGSVVISGRSAGQGIVFGIDNVDFAKVGWWREDLFPAHPYKYLDLLGYYEQAVIIPENFAEKYHLKTGDLVSIAVQQQLIEFVVVGILPYWPSQYPDETPFFITNLEYIYDQVPMMPYQLWLKMEEGAKVAPIITTLQEKKIEISSVQDVRNELITQGKHPSRGGVFGILSLGFLVSVFVSLFGYILYWFFNLSSRVVQFGVLRAMGLSRRQLTGMLFLEQGFTAGLSILLGIGIGKLTSMLFLPFLQTTENIKTQVPPFRVIFDSRDTLQLYIVVTVMMLTGVGLLFMHIRRLRVHQAVKLGEER
jgi:putative ABC transport system permease protein